MLVFELKNLTIDGDGSPHSIRVRMVDETEGNSLSVYCAIDDLQAPNSLSFLSTQPLPDVPFGMILNIDNFSHVVSVPTEVLTFPRRGRRTIDASIEVLESDRVIQRAQTRFQVEGISEGYIEGIENRERSEEMGIYLAMHLAASDGDIDKLEADVVKGWVKTILSTSNEGARKERQNRMNTVLADAFAKSIDSSLDLAYISGELKEKASMPIKYEIIEVCMDVMKADGVADPNEIRELKRIAKMIGLDENRYTALLDKRLAEVKTIGVATTENLATLVGISSSMSKEEVRRHLTKEYRKWNARVSHDDQAIRERAEQMIEHIAEARNQYL
ncbi:TerB family tellurite resistance protein [bacterium]|nr:TerB family tellurite resistance protein [bacterium]